MSNRTLEFILDFGSPNAYLSWRVLPALLQRTGATLMVTPCLLGGIFKATNNRSPMEAFGPVKGKMAYERMEMQRFIARHGLTEFRMNSHFPVNTLHLMRGAVAAQMEPDPAVFTRYLDVAMRGMWERSLKLDDPALLAATLAESGLDAARLGARMLDADVKQRLVDNTAAAVERGVFGIPTFLVGTEMWFGKDRLRDVEDYLLAAG
ncbi:MAG: 2-hydroxychromene-2-carboxylate isomerase [Aquabacterium sp.]